MCFALRRADSPHDFRQQPDILLMKREHYDHSIKNALKIDWLCASSSARRARVPSTRKGCMCLYHADPPESTTPGQRSKTEPNNREGNDLQITRHRPHGGRPRLVHRPSHDRGQHSRTTSDVLGPFSARRRPRRPTAWRGSVACTGHPRRIHRSFGHRPEPAGAISRYRTQERTATSLTTREYRSCGIDGDRSQP